MVIKNSVLPAGRAFFKRHATTIGQIVLGLLVLLHGLRAWAFATWQGHEAVCIGAAGLAITYSLALVVYWAQGWSGLMVFSMINTGLISTLQVVFPEASGHLGILTVAVQFLGMGWVAVGNLVHRP